MPVPHDRRLAALAALLALAGCGRTGSVLLGGAPEPGRDAGAPVDAGTVDAGPPDAGAPSPDLGFGRALACGLETSEALRAAARFVACAEQVTMSGVMEAHEGFALGAMDPFAAQLAGLPSACGIWQCAASVRSCAAFGTCLEDTSLPNRRCGELELTCEGDVLGLCLGPFVIPHLDCGALGATCERGACVRQGCRFGNGETPARCDAQGERIELCAGIGLECAAWREGSICASFFVGGEIPVPWCAPREVGSVPGAYNQPVDCRDGVVTFSTMSGRPHRFDCRAAGYRRCDERGCVD